MNLLRVLGAAALICGVVLFAFGVKSTGKVSEKVVEGVTGKYSDNTMWYLIGGIALVVVGGGMMLRRRR